MIQIKTPDEIAYMREAGLVTQRALAAMRAAVAPGVSTADLDRIAEDSIRSEGGVPSFLGYRGFTGTICASINDEVVHGIPSSTRVLREGDIIGLDYGVIYQGYYGDSAITVPVGAVKPAVQDLMRTTREALEAGIEAARPGRRLGDVSSAIQTHAEGAGFSVVRDFVGHGIGKRLHEDPQVPNFGQADRGIRLREGMVLAIEPMLNAGGPEVELKEDGWTAITSDGSLSAHFEHSVAIVEGGPWVLSSL